MKRKFWLLLLFVLSNSCFGGEQTSPSLPTVASGKKIVVVGGGYVGVVTGSCLASVGNQVCLVENAQARLDMLLKGKVPFFEPRLDEEFLACIKQQRMTFVGDVAAAMATKPDIVFICVGTPPLPDGSADLAFVMNVADQIGKSLTAYCVVVVKSTVPVGTAEKVKHCIALGLEQRGAAIDFDVASNPEFLREGSAVSDFMFPDRIVIGVQAERAVCVLRELYQPFITRDDQLLVMKAPSAELTKYASNAMLATRISFMNELAHLAEAVGADINEIKLGMAKDRRIGKYFLDAGVGYGGSCFPKDVTALVAMGKEHQCEMSLVDCADHVNKQQRLWFVNKILNFYGDQIGSKYIGIWGLSFKPNTDDIRCAPSLDIIQVLLDKGARIAVYDPVAMDNIRALFGEKIEYACAPGEILNKCDALVLLTDWADFLKYKPEQFLGLKDRVIFDGRNCFNPGVMRASSLTYQSVGRA